MESKELRIGNWVKIQCVSEQPLVVDVWDNQEFNAFNMQSLLFNSPDFIFKPIPLTKEWLVKFGFDNLGTFGFGIGKFHIRYGKTARDFYFFIDNEFVHIKSVHQLQNLYFALNREELTIK